MALKVNAVEKLVKFSKNDPGIKWIVQIIASVATAIVTALSATSCVGM